MRFAWVLLPVGALVAVAAIIAGIQLSGSDDGNPAAPAPTQGAAVPPAAVQGFDPQASVCEGILSRPAPGAPRTFPAAYTKREDVHGLTVVSTAKVSDAAFAEARKTIERMFANNNLAEPLTEQGAYVIIVEPGKGVLDLPEFGCLQGQVDTNFFSHVCGIADRADYPVATVNELDLVGDRSGPCGGLNILYHEIGHLVQNWTLDPPDYYDIKLYYQDAMNDGKYRRLYAATNPNEYFAEATQAYFLTADLRGTQDRAWLKDYDPQLYALLERIYGP